MAEDEIQEMEEDVEEEEELSEDEVEKRIVDCHDRGKPCNRRIDELALPSKRLLLCTFRDFGHRFPKEWNERIKELLSILYAMTPEETEKYFEQLRAMAKQMALRKKLKDKLKKLVMKKKKKEIRQKVYSFFKNIIKYGLTHAATQDVPPLVSVRMRNLSDIILQQLADLRCVEVPDRQNPGIEDKFCKVQEVRIDPCKEAARKKPCVLRKEKNATISFDYKPLFDTDVAYGMAYSETFVADLPMPGMNKYACNFTTCPIVNGQTATYSVNLFMRESFPSAPYTVKIWLWDALHKDSKNNYIGCCFTVDINLKASSNSNTSYMSYEVISV